MKNHAEPLLVAAKSSNTLPISQELMKLKREFGKTQAKRRD